MSCPIGVKRQTTVLHVKLRRAFVKVTRRRLLREVRVMCLRIYPISHYKYSGKVTNKCVLNVIRQETHSLNIQITNRPLFDSISFCLNS